MNNNLKIGKQQMDEKDLKMIRLMKKFADKGYDVEFRKDCGGGYKILRVNKSIIKAD
jgi:hypothetical protein